MVSRMAASSARWRSSSTMCARSSATFASTASRCSVVASNFAAASCAAAWAASRSARALTTAGSDSIRLSWAPARGTGPATPAHPAPAAHPTASARTVAVAAPTRRIRESVKSTPPTLSTRAPPGLARSRVARWGTPGLRPHPPDGPAQLARAVGLRLADRAAQLPGQWRSRRRRWLRGGFDSRRGLGPGGGPAPAAGSGPGPGPLGCPVGAEREPEHADRGRFDHDDGQHAVQRQCQRARGQHPAAAKSSTRWTRRPIHGQAPSAPSLRSERSRRPPPRPTRTAVCSPVRAPSIRRRAPRSISASWWAQNGTAPAAARS